MSQCVDDLHLQLNKDIYCNSLNSIKDDILQLKNKVKLLIIVCSTTGNGDAPDNADKFWRILKNRSLNQKLYENMPYAILGLGDTNYDKFCHMGKVIDKRLRELGGNCCIELHCADEAVGSEIVVDDWLIKAFELIKNE